MAWMTMTLPGLYNYALNTHNVDIFENLTVPASIDRSTLIDLLLIRSAPFELLYPNATYLKAAIGTWSATHQRTFQKWMDALSIQYDPLNNYDRTETMSESELENRLRKGSSRVDVTDTESNDTESTTNRTQNSATIGNTKDNATNGANTTNSVSAYDSNAWSNKDKSDSTTTNANSGTNMQSISGTDKDESTSYTDRVGTRTDIAKDTENENKLNARSHNLRAYGNIGVTTSQQMLESELKVSAWNVYEHISDLFLDEFCVLLY